MLLDSIFHGVLFVTWCMYGPEGKGQKRLSGCASYAQHCFKYYHNQLNENMIKTDCGAQQMVHSGCGNRLQKSRVQAAGVLKPYDWRIQIFNCFCTAQQVKGLVFESNQRNRQAVVKRIKRNGCE